MALADAENLSDTCHTGGLVSYTDGSTWDFESDYLVIFAQSDDFCNPPVPYKPGSDIILCCAPEKGGCSCNVGCKSDRSILSRFDGLQNDVLD